MSSLPPMPSNQKPPTPDKWQRQMAKMLRKYDEDLLEYKEHPENKEIIEKIHDDAKEMASFLKEHRQDIIKEAKKNKVPIKGENSVEESLQTAIDVTDKANNNFETNSADILKVAFSKLNNFVNKQK